MTNLIKFLKGYVVISLSGYAPERFLNLCSRHGIILWGLQSRGLHYEMCISISGFRKLRPLVRKTRTKVVILERHGLPFILYRYRTRKLFLVGALGCALLLYILSLYIWNIHVEGNLALSDQVILEYLESRQIVHGMRKSQVHGEEIEAGLREYFPDITWTSAEVKGTRLIIHIQENEDARHETVPKDQPASLAATKSGTISSMIVRSGTPLVQVGEEVEAGTVLVQSQVDILNDSKEVENSYYVHADADILIRMQGTYQESFPLKHEEKVYTGKTRTAFSISVAGHQLTVPLPGKKLGTCDSIADEYPLKITENFYLPVSFGKITFQEYTLQKAVYTEEEAVQIAGDALDLFYEKLEEKGILLIENNVKIQVHQDVCTASGTYIYDEAAVKETESGPPDEARRISRML